MSGFLNSIVRGAGHTIGRRAVDSFLDNPREQKALKSSEIDCWSHMGYQENDVEILYEYDYFKKQIKWYSWIVFFIPIVNLFKSIPYFYNVFLKKNKVYYYDLKWIPFKVSDGRVKGGIKEIQKLQPELSKSEVFPPYTRNKIESIISLSLSLIISIQILVGIYLTINQ